MHCGWKLIQMRSRECKILQLFYKVRRWWSFSILPKAAERFLRAVSWNIYKIFPTDDCIKQYLRFTARWSAGQLLGYCVYTGQALQYLTVANEHSLWQLQGTIQSTYTSFLFLISTVTLQTHDSHFMHVTLIVVSLTQQFCLRESC